MLLVYKVGAVVENGDRALEPVCHALTWRCRTQLSFQNSCFDYVYYTAILLRETFHYQRIFT